MPTIPIFAERASIRARKSLALAAAEAREVVDIAKNYSTLPQASSRGSRAPGAERRDVMEQRPGRTIAAMLTFAGLLSLLIWLYLFFLHGRFWRLGAIRAIAPGSVAAAARIAVVIPARDEADVVGQCVAS